MNYIKKGLSLLLSFILAFTMITIVKATDQTFTIKVDPADSHTYTVYQVFTGSYALIDEVPTLGNLKFRQTSSSEVGEIVSSGLVNQLQNYSNDKGVANHFTTYINFNSTPYGTVSASQPLSNVEPECQW